MGWTSKRKSSKETVEGRLHSPTPLHETSGLATLLSSCSCSDCVSMFVDTASSDYNTEALWIEPHVVDHYIIMLSWSQTAHDKGSNLEMIANMTSVALLNRYSTPGYHVATTTSRTGALSPAFLLVPILPRTTTAHGELAMVHAHYCASARHSPGDVLM